MEIVDTFTRLILAADEGLSPHDQSIVHTLCLVDDNAAHCHGEERPQELGAYLRELGVSEMIRLVKRVRANYLAPAQTESVAAEGQSARF